MLSLKEIREYIASLGFAEDSNVYMGKLDNKQLKSIGVYSRPINGGANIAAGGISCTTHETKPISLLIHWNKSKGEAEKVAYNLFNKLKEESSLIIGEHCIDYMRLMVPEPQDVGTDDNGTHEYVIWLDLIYVKKGGN